MPLLLIGTLLLNYFHTGGLLPLARSRRLLSSHSAAPGCCVKVRCLYAPVCASELWWWRGGDGAAHWFHHGIEPVLGADAHNLVPAGARCTLVVEPGLRLALERSLVVRHFFERILTRNRFQIGEILSPAGEVVDGRCVLLPLPSVANLTAADTSSVREALWAGCAADAREHGRPRRSEALTLVYDRDWSRRLANAPAVVDHLAKRFGRENVAYMKHSDRRSGCELAAALAAARVVVTPHGFNAYFVTMMALNSTLVEVYPAGYTFPDIPILARRFGVKHKHLLSTPMDWTQAGRLVSAWATKARATSMLARTWLRSYDVAADLDALDRATAGVRLPRTSNKARGDNSSS